MLRRQLFHKKGIELTFNWIFAIIAGGMIFLFLGYFAAQNTDLFGKITSVRVGEELNIAFSGLKTGVVDTKIEFDKNVDLSFVCLSGVERLRIGFREGARLYDNLVFSNEKLEGEEFYLMTKSWNIPYRVDNFIFVSDGKKFGITGPYPNRLEENLPESFKNFIEITSLGVDKHIKFVIGSFSSCSLAPNEDVKIYLLDNDGNYGYICAKNDEGNIEEYPFYGDAMIYAAIFGDQFGCLHEVLVEKLKIMSSVYDKKIDSIGSSKCTLIYNEMKLSLANLANLENNLIGFKNAVGVVESKNKELIANGCEPVF